MYYWYLGTEHFNTNILQLSVVTLAAFAGAFLGNRFLKKVEISFIHKAVTFFLITIAILLIAGLI